MLTSGKGKTIAGVSSQFYHRSYTITVLSSQLYHRSYIIAVKASHENLTFILLFISVFILNLYLHLLIYIQTISALWSLNGIFKDYNFEKDIFRLLSKKEKHNVTFCVKNAPKNIIQVGIKIIKCLTFYFVFIHFLSIIFILSLILFFLEMVFMLRW